MSVWYVCIGVSMHVCLCLYAHVCIHMCACVYICMCVYVYMCLCVCLEEKSVHSSFQIFRGVLTLQNSKNSFFN